MILEVIAHRKGIPFDFRLAEISVPELVDVQTLDTSALPNDWRQESRNAITAELGTNWANSLASSILQVPSAVVPEESNFILNPRHPDFKKMRFRILADHEIDRRLRV